MEELQEKTEAWMMRNIWKYNSVSQLINDAVLAINISYVPHNSQSDWIVQMANEIFCKETQRRNKTFLSKVK